MVGTIASAENNPVIWGDSDKVEILSCCKVAYEVRFSGSGWTAYERVKPRLNRKDLPVCVEVGAG